MTKTIKTVGANSPDISNINGGLNPVTTWYLTWDESGAEIRTPITESPPENWYNYSEKRWANIVTTSEDRSRQAYLVWIPRYAYKTSTTTKQYMDIIWLRDTSQEIPEGYSLPEAFIWSNTEGDTAAGNQIRGFWTTKYEVSP